MNIYVQSGINPAGDTYIYIYIHIRMIQYVRCHPFQSPICFPHPLARFGTLASLSTLAAWHMIRQPARSLPICCWLIQILDKPMVSKIREWHPYMWIKYIQPMITVLHVCIFAEKFCWLTPRVHWLTSPTMFDGYWKYGKHPQMARLIWFTTR